MAPRELEVGGRGKGEMGWEKGGMERRERRERVSRVGLKELDLENSATIGAISRKFVVSGQGFVSKFCRCYAYNGRNFTSFDGNVKRPPPSPRPLKYNLSAGYIKFHAPHAPPLPTRNAARCNVAFSFQQNN